MNRIKISDDHEGTRTPFWIIIEPRQNLYTDRDGVINIKSMITGLWFSREAAENHLKTNRYNYNKHAMVYCHAGCYSQDWEDAVKNGENDDCENCIVVSKNREGMVYPYWMIVDPRQNFWVDEDGLHRIAGMITGVWFNRESAEAVLKSTRYNFGRSPEVWCFTGKLSIEYQLAINNGDKNG